MTTRDRPGDRGRARGQRLVREFSQEFRAARRAVGLSQEAVARACGVSRATIERLELGNRDSLSIIHAAQLAAIVGLDLSLRTFPGPAHVRDAAQLRLLRRFIARLGPLWRWQFEFLVGPAPDQRAWDARGVCPTTGAVVVVEAVTRLTDAQDTLRRLALKRRDGGFPRVVLVVAETRTNTLALALAGDVIRAEYPVATRRALRELAAGRDPGGDALVIL